MLFLCRRAVLGQGPHLLIRPSYNFDVNLEFSAFNGYLCEITGDVLKKIIQIVLLKTTLTIQDN